MTSFLLVLACILAACVVVVVVAFTVGALHAVVSGFRGAKTVTRTVTMYQNAPADGMFTDRDIQAFVKKLEGEL